MSWSLTIALTADCLAAFLGLYLIFSEAQKRRPSQNKALSVLTLALLVVVGVCFYVYSLGNHKLAGILAWVPAVPILGYCLLVVLMVLLKPDYK